MTFSALDSELTGPLLATDAMRAVFADRARVKAMLAAEAALARAEAEQGLVPKALAGAIEKVSADGLDIPALGRETAVAGVPAIPFVKAVRARLPATLRSHFHFGTTTQDIADTALALQMADAFPLIADDLKAIGTGLARLAKAHRRTPMAGRTYGQHAAPVTFGYVAAVWLAGTADAAADLPRVRRRALVASLGGPVGTRTALGDKGPAVLAAFAKALGLSAPAVAPHVLRGRMAETGAWLAMMIGALAKMAEDVARLATTEVGEVAERYVPGRGGSSALPHKRNPVSATVILAAQSAAKGQVVTLLDAMAAEHQRPAGRWHAEWHALPALFGLASGALREARRLAEGLVVDRKRMRENLDLTHGLLFAEAAAARLAPALGREAADALVEAAADMVRRTGMPLQALLAEEAAIPARLRADLAGAFDLAPSVDAAASAVDRILAATRKPGGRPATRKGKR